jgi:hypothetical protein
MSSSENTNEPSEQQNKKPIKGKSDGPLTYKQQLKQDAMLWAEFLYAEYKREKTLEGEA